MTIEFKELFGLGAVSDEAIEARAEQAEAEMLPSHWGRYDDVTLENGLKVIRQTYTDGNVPPHCAAGPIFDHPCSDGSRNESDLPGAGVS